MPELAQKQRCEQKAFRSMLTLVGRLFQSPQKRQPGENRNGAVLSVGLDPTTRKKLRAFLRKDLHPMWWEDG